MRVASRISLRTSQIRWLVQNIGNHQSLVAVQTAMPVPVLVGVLRQRGSRSRNRKVEPCRLMPATALSTGLRCSRLLRRTPPRVPLVLLLLPLVQLLYPLRQQLRQQ